MGAVISPSLKESSFKPAFAINYFTLNRVCQPCPFPSRVEARQRRVRLPAKRNGARAAMTPAGALNANGYQTPVDAKVEPGRRMHPRGRRIARGRNRRRLVHLLQTIHDKEGWALFVE